MLGMFELFREAGIRLPKAVGQTLAVVGGLIVGDASNPRGAGFADDAGRRRGHGRCNLHAYQSISERNG